ncbi:MAG TPA: hypothetical protein VJY62_03030, partial [Bacteroidia bacterium]|nr:hypothetical protein [Bacteroidia bacterium]
MKKLISGIMLFLYAGVLHAANYYWTSGTGNWSNFASHWATSSGGTTFHSAPPGPSDDVFFDANSFLNAGDTVYVDVANAFCKNFDWTGSANNPVFTSSLN